MQDNKNKLVGNTNATQPTATPVKSNWILTIIIPILLFIFIFIIYSAFAHKKSGSSATEAASEEE